MNVIYALWLRQLKHYVRSRARMVGSLAQPLLFLVGLGFGFGQTFEKAGNGSYLQFLAPGIICMGVLFTAMFSGMEMIWDRQFGFLKETLVAPVARMQIVAGRILGGATVAVIQGLMVALICLIAGFRIEHPAMLPLALLFLFLIAILFAAIGTTLGSLVEDMHAFPLIMNFLVMPLFFFSGALFPANQVPATLHLLMRLNPLSYGVDGVRGALTRTLLYGFSADIIVLLLLSALMLSIASWCFARIEA
ncbi:MAG: ABC transporter permease [Steroidobacteraceae bacterium]